LLRVVALVSPMSIRCVSAEAWYSFSPMFMSSSLIWLISFSKAKGVPSRNNLDVSCLLW
jgi:hypothetical protein